MTQYKLEQHLFNYWMENYPEEVSCKDDCQENFDFWLEKEGEKNIRPLVEKICATRNPEIINPLMQELGY